MGRSLKTEKVNLEDEIKDLKRSKETAENNEKRLFSERNQLRAEKKAWVKNFESEKKKLEEELCSSSREVEKLGIENQQLSAEIQRLKAEMSRRENSKSIKALINRTEHVSGQDILKICQGKEAVRSRYFENSCLEKHLNSDVNGSGTPKNRLEPPSTPRSKVALNGSQKKLTKSFQLEEDKSKGLPYGYQIKENARKRKFVAELPAFAKAAKMNKTLYDSKLGSSTLENVDLSEISNWTYTSVMSASDLKKCMNKSISKISQQQQTSSNISLLNTISKSPKMITIGSATVSSNMSSPKNTSLNRNIISELQKCVSTSNNQHPQARSPSNFNCSENAMLNKNIPTNNIQQAKSPLNSSKNTSLNKNIVEQAKSPFNSSKNTSLNKNIVQQAKSPLNYSKKASLSKSITEQIENGLATTSSSKNISAVKHIDCIDLTLEDEDNEKVGGAASNENQKACGDD